MTDKPLSLPSSGGSYIRDEKGALKPAPTKPAKGATKPTVKEG